MSLTNNEMREFIDLLHALREEVISDEQFQKLEKILSEDLQTRQVYIDYFMLYSDLMSGFRSSVSYDEKLRPTTNSASQQLDKEIAEFDTKMWQALAKEEMTAPAIEIEKPTQQEEPVKMLKIETPPRTINKFSLYSVIVSVAALVFVLIYVQVAPPPASSVAVIADSVDAQWAQSEHPTDIGSRLWDNEGSRWLQKGTVKIEFDYGAGVVIEGPAEFELKDAEKMVLHSGRLYATVPGRATGFTVQTPCSTVIDLGTEFGVLVNFDGSTDVHMFKGKASLIPGRNGEKEDSLELLVGQAKSVNTYGQVRDVELSEEKFLKPDQFEVMSKADKGSAYHRWIAYSDAMHRDPALVAHYTFEEDSGSPDLLKNEAPATLGRLQGILGKENNNAPEWVQGRWPEKQALRFDTKKGHGVSIPPDRALSITGPITIAVWGMFPEEGPDCNSGFVLACRDGYKINYIVRVSEKQTEMKRYYADRYVYQRKFSLKQELPESWCLCVITHDGKTVRYYLNGKLWHSYPLEFTVADPIEADLILGKFKDWKSAELTGAHEVVGTLDELAIFNRVLNENEIRLMYEAGTPE